MRLIIAEKPSLGAAIANALPGPHKRHKGYIETARGDCVTWCVGHLLEQAEPDAYDPSFKQWRLDHLPIIPRQWQLNPRKDVRGQLTTIRKLLKTATVIVHAGDPDREGQLLVDEVLNHLKLSAKRKKEVLRLLVSDLNTAAIKRSLSQMRSNSDFIPLSVSALTRARADWLYGINLTRAYTLIGRRGGIGKRGDSGKKGGQKQPLSVGRVQSPILGLVVRRDEEIERFQPVPYFELFAVMQTTDNKIFKAKWLPSEACQPWMDSEGRVLDRRLAENVARRIEGKQGEVVGAKNSPKKESAPLPYSLSALQIDAARRFRMSAGEVLEQCQSLYEKKLVTYPRSDCRYLPAEHFREAPELLSVVRDNDPSLDSAVDGADASRRGRAWNDSKVTAHHAIIPTRKRTDLQKLKPSQQKIYTLIARQYVAQFYPDHRTVQQELILVIEGGRFRARGQKVLEIGWKSVISRKESQTDEPKAPLPTLQTGDHAHCNRAELQDKITQPPAAFTDATLLSAITGIARFVKDPEIRKVLRETDGLGTEATRAGMIELLFRRNYLMRKGKKIHATATGKALVALLPEAITRPDTTARWEQALNDIVEQKGSYQRFMSSLEQTLHEMIADLKKPASQKAANPLCQ